MFMTKVAIGCLQPISAMVQQLFVFMCAMLIINQLVWSSSSSSCCLAASVSTIVTTTPSASTTEGVNHTLTTITTAATTTTTSTLLTSTTSCPQHAWRLVTRQEWHARKPNDKIDRFNGPAPYVIIHHSYQPGVCHTQDACKAAMRSIQNYHMDGHHWPDIGYNFAIGGDGNVYEGRGYNVVGAHAPDYNNRSIGLLFIGNFMEKSPPAPMLAIAQDFLKFSVENGHLRDDYILYGHRQVRETKCPGDVLYNDIKKWLHWIEAVI